MKNLMNYILLTCVVAAFALVPGRAEITFAQEQHPVDVSEEPPAKLREAREKLSKLAEVGEFQEMIQLNQELAEQFPSGNVSFEQIESCGFYPQEARLACAVRIKQRSGYGGFPAGSMEHIKFCIDWHGNNSWELFDSVGESHVNVHDASSDFPRGGWNYLVYRDINPWSPTFGPRTLDAVTNSTPTVRARAILSWFSPATTCNDRPFWGNTYEFNIQLDPMR